MIDKENTNKLENIIKKVANEWDLKICSLNIQTNQNPTVVKIIIKKTNGDDISLEDCALFNAPASEVIENSNLLNCSYAVSYTHLTLPTTPYV